MTTTEIENKVKEEKNTCATVKGLCELYVSCYKVYNFKVATKLKGVIAEILGGYGPAYIELARYYKTLGEDHELEARNYYADFLARYQDTDPAYVAEARQALKRD